MRQERVVPQVGGRGGGLTAAGMSILDAGGGERKREQEKNNKSKKPFESARKNREGNRTLKVY